MATETEEAPNANVNGDNNVRALYDVVRGFPHRAVAELLSIGVCTRCVLQLFGVRDGVHYRCPLSSSMLSSVLSDSTDLENHGDLGEPVVCSLCLGILQFSFRGDKEVVKKESAEELAFYISSLIRNQGYEIDSFSLEVSIPPIILEKERTVLLHLKTKYESELWFQERSLPECTSVKDALKVSLTEALETMLDCKSSVGTFRIRLTYTHPIQSETIENSTEGGRDSKRLKTGTVLTNDHGIQCVKSSTSESGVERTIESSKPLEQINEPCSFEFFCSRSQIYFGGRYMKFSRNVSQTRWIIDDERMGEASVEEIIGSNILPICRGDNYKFHAAGREDIDVRMLGSGRPFLIEVQNARHVPSEESVKDLQRKINDLQNKLVGVKNLKLVGSQSWDLMREGEAEKQKQYTALVWTSRILTDEDLQPISSIKDMHILQRTPIRVLHRRSPLERERIIHWMRVKRLVGSPQYFLLHLCTQAGTYIKEFVHGDLGRTQPSFGSILGTRAEILQLDVTDVKMDCFLTE